MRFALSRGVGSASVNLSNTSASDSSFLTPTAEYSIRADGSVFKTDSLGNNSFFENWITNPALASDYDVMVTASAGVSTGTLGTWLALTSDRSWTLTNSVGGTTVSTVLTVKIRNRVLGGTVVATATVTLTAQKF